MGKLILCNGVRTKRPYGFASTGVRIYSIEELCYYLYHNVYFVEENMFSESLIEWIKTELKLPDRAEKLRQLKSQRSDIKSMVTVILCSADYYTETEIKGLLKVLDEIIGMPLLKRNYIKANNFLKSGQYHEAAAEYDRLLNSPEATGLTPEEYGDILHNFGVAKIYITGLKEASELFQQAYERNHREESLRQYLISLKLSNNEKLYREEAEMYQVSEEFTESLHFSLKQITEEAAHSVHMEEIKELKHFIAQGDKKEYYKKAEEILESWKTKIRQI